MKHMTFAGTLANGQIGADCSCGWEVHCYTSNPLTDAAYAAQVHMQIHSKE